MSVIQPQYFSNTFTGYVFEEPLTRGGWVIGIMVFTTSLVLMIYRKLRSEKISRQLKLLLGLTFVITLIWLLWVIREYFAPKIHSAQFI